MTQGSEGSGSADSLTIPAATRCSCGQTSRWKSVSMFGSWTWRSFIDDCRSERIKDVGPSKQIARRHPVTHRSGSSRVPWPAPAKRLVVDDTSFEWLYDNLVMGLEVAVRPSGRLRVSAKEVGT